MISLKILLDSYSQDKMPMIHVDIGLQIKHYHLKCQLEYQKQKEISVLLCLLGFKEAQLWKAGKTAIHFYVLLMICQIIDSKLRNIFDCILNSVKSITSVQMVHVDMTFTNVYNFVFQICEIFFKFKLKPSLFSKICHHCRPPGTNDVALQKQNARGFRYTCQLSDKLLLPIELRCYTAWHKAGYCYSPPVLL